jgi:hypothetical protein
MHAKRQSSLLGNNACRSGSDRVPSYVPGHSSRAGPGQRIPQPVRVPSVVLPFAADQFFWAEQLRRRGIAPAAASSRNITAATLSRAITAARTSQMRERASAVGAKMRAEDGLGEAVGRVHALMAR